MIALYRVGCNFVKMHRTLDPALAAGVTDALWSMRELVALVDAFDAAQPCNASSRSVRDPLMADRSAPSLSPVASRLGVSIL
jgi:hypothetical protein